MKLPSKDQMARHQTQQRQLLELATQERELGKKRRFWLISLKSMLGVSIIWQITFTVAFLLSVSKGISSRALQKNGLFLVLRVTGTVATLVFLFTSLVLKAQISRLPKTTQYE